MDGTEKGGRRLQGVVFGVWLMVSTLPAYIIRRRASRSSLRSSRHCWAVYTGLW